MAYDPSILWILENLSIHFKELIFFKKKKLKYFWTPWDFSSEIQGIYEAQNHFWKEPKKGGCSAQSHGCEQLRNRNRWVFVWHQIGASLRNNFEYNYNF